MLAKPTMRVPHEGGQRFAEESEAFETIVEWISQGAPFGDPAADSVARIEVEPTEILLRNPDATKRSGCRALRGRNRPETSRASPLSRATPPAPRRFEEGGIVRGERVGEAAIMVRYEGKFTTVPLTVLNPAPGFAWKQLPQHNFIDKHIDAKLKRLKIQPSEVASRRGLPSTRLPRPHRNPANAGAGASVPGGPGFVAGQARALDRGSRRQRALRPTTGRSSGATCCSRTANTSARRACGRSRQWIRDAIATNQPYDDFVRELLTSVGSTFQSPAANFFR